MEFTLNIVAIQEEIVYYFMNLNILVLLVDITE